MRGGIACDLCELRRDLTWVMRTAHFTVIVGGEPHRYADDEEWALCSMCERDVQADDQTPIMMRRRAAIIRDSTPGWDALSDDDQAFTWQVLDLIVMTALSCRQKNYGRAWTPSDARNAARQVRDDGGRGLRH